MVTPDLIVVLGDAKVVEIEGIQYDANMFRQLGGLLPIDKPFRVIGRQDGVLCIEKLQWVS